MHGSAGRTRRFRNLGSGLVAVAVVAGLGGVGATVALSVGGPVSPASADPVAACTTTAGVVVAVDFRPFGGQVQAGCDLTLTNGLDALEAAGFTPTGTSQYGLAFICLIDGYPQNQGCTSTPPASASWSYWLAAPGTNRWTFSADGAESTTPQAGSTEAWTFGSSGPDDKPDFTPRQVRATTTTTTTTTTSTTSSTSTTAPTTTTTSGIGGPPTTTAPANGRGSGQSGHVGAGIGGTDAASGGTSVTTHAVTTPTVNGDTTSPTTAGSTQDGSGGLTVIAASPVSSDQHGTSGSPLTAVIAVLAVVALGGSAGIIAWRRRRAA